MCSNSLRERWEETRVLYSILLSYPFKSESALLCPALSCPILSSITNLLLPPVAYDISGAMIFYVTPLYICISHSVCVPLLTNSSLPGQLALLPTRGLIVVNSIVLTFVIIYHRTEYVRYCTWQDRTVGTPFQGTFCALAGEAHREASSFPSGGSAGGGASTAALVGQRLMDMFWGISWLLYFVALPNLALSHLTSDTLSVITSFSFFTPYAFNTTQFSMFFILRS